MAFDVQNIYSTPQIPRKRQCLRPRRMTLIDLRNVRVEEDEEPYRKSSTATIRSEGTGTQFYNRYGGIQPLSDSDNSSLDSYKSNISQMRIRRVSSSFDSTSRFPKLQECAHFHYDVVELPQLQVCLCDDEQENCHHNAEDYLERTFLVRVTCNEKTWNVKRTFKNFRMLDRQLHKCIFDRRFSKLTDLQTGEDGSKTYEEMERMLQFYLQRFTVIADSMINCGSILNWFELDNRGNRLLIVDDTGINTPAIAAAHAVKRYTAQAVDEISLEVGDIVSVIDMPSPEDTMWWRGKRGFEVGFFPSECVEVIGEKVPASVQSRIPLSSNSKKPLVRKHGKFLSFLRMFFSTRPARIQLKQSGIVKERVFGCDLGEHLLNSGHDVPLVLKCCSDIIEEYGIVDGIYRLSGITSNIQKLRHAFDEDRIPDLTEEVYLQDIHSISSLLKMYFRELPNPLLTYQLYDKFAAAVRDEENKLLKIHDVVQQLPPPHYRTTEYLMRHLAKVAAYGSETGMHSKNLAIVWAPNLLRSKELECGGGAAALQGVGIQAVVTECLILYADLIFSDKMPSYSSPELRQSRKKPRPKSLAISTPTKLITLEEARERALSASLRPPPQKYIDVGGGPKNLPDRYHTVIDLPGYRKKIPLKDVENLKAKKSPSGWRSIFSKSTRQGSIKHKGHKGSMPDTSSVGKLERKAITEEDVHNWKRRRLRGAKSAESLLNMPSSSLDTRRMSRLIDENMLGKMFEECERGTRHKRSLSSESPRSLMHSDHSVSYPSFIVAGSREVPIDVDASAAAATETNGSESTSPDNFTKRKQSFVRNETKRRVVTHRRTSSGQSTPRQDSPSREKSRSPKPQKQKTPSQMVVDGEHKVKAGVSHDLMSSSIDAEKFVLHIDDVKLLKPTEVQRKSSENSSNEDLREKQRGARTPPRDKKESKTPPRERRRNRDEKKEKNMISKDESDAAVSQEVMTIDLPESPGAKRKNWLGSSSSTPASTPDEPPAHYYFSRHHDYAEILSEDEDLARSRQMKMESNVNTCEQVQMRSDSSNLSANIPVNLNRLSDSYDNVPDTYFYLPHSETDDVGLNSQQTHTIYNSQNHHSASAHSDFHISENRPRERIPAFKMAKCLSVPSDIQKSLENMTSGSQTDLLSSVTISELSTSVDSFNFSGEDPSLTGRSRRSTSLDNIAEKASPITRTLMEINAEIDQAFKREPDKSRIYEQINHSKQQDKRPIEGSAVISPDSLYKVSQDQRLNKDMTGTYVDRPVAEVQIIETPRVIRAPLRPKVSPPQAKSAKLVTQSSQIDSSLTMETTTVLSSNQMSTMHSVQDTHSLQYSQSTHTALSKSEMERSFSKEHTSVHMTSPKQARSPTPDEAFLKELCSPTGSPSQSRNQTVKNTRFSPVASPMEEQGFPRSLSNQSPTQNQYRESPLTSPTLNRAGNAHPTAVVQRRPRRSPATTPTQGPGHSWYQRSPSSSPGQGQPRSGHSSPFMSPSSPEQTRIMDARKSQLRHGKVTFDLSEEDLHFLSEQGRKRESFQKSDSQLSDSSSITSSPESKSKQNQSKEDFKQRHPAKRDFPQLLLSSTAGPDSSSTSSPRSPRQQPRWEDLAGLNQDFRAMAGLDSAKSKSKENVKGKSVSQMDDFASPTQEDDSFNKKLQDLSDFNDIWRRQLAPTGDVCRTNEKEDGSTTHGISSERKETESESQDKYHLKKSSTIAAMEMASDYQHPCSTRERTPECGMEERTLILEKPMIKKCLTESDIPQIKHCSLMTQDSVSTTSSSGTSDHPSNSQVTSDFYPSTFTNQEVVQNSRTHSLSDIHTSCDQIMMERPVLQRAGSRDGSITSVHPGNNNFDRSRMEEKMEAPKPSKIQKVDRSNIVLDLPVLPPLELSGFPQFENSNISHITGASAVHHTGNSGILVAAQHGSCATDVVNSQENNAQGEIFSFEDNGDNRVYPLLESQRGQLFNDDNSKAMQPMMDDIDINESCFGIPTHQNLSNEMREKVQERLKAAQEQGPPMSSADNSSFQGMEAVQMGSFIYQKQSEHAVHMGYEVKEDEGQIQSSQRMEMEATVQFSSELSSVSLPGEDLQILSQGPMITAEADVVEQLQPTCQSSVPLDNSEEAAQNAINADRELSMTLQSSMGQGKTIDDDDDDDRCGTCQNFATKGGARGLEHMRLVQPVDSAVTPIIHSPLPELAPPEREFLEVSRPSVIKSIQRKSLKTLRTSRQGGKQEKNKSQTKEESSSERGESKVVIEHRPSFKKKAPVPLPAEKTFRTSRLKEDLYDLSDINDDVFVDDVKSTITHSKLVPSRHQSVMEKCSSPVSAFLKEPPNRSSLDDSALQMAATRHDDFSSEDSDLEKKEDIRFTRAHKSAKLQSLKELFEKSCEDKQKEKLSSNDKKSISQEKKSASQEGLASLASVVQSPGKSEANSNSDVSRVAGARSAFSQYRSHSQTTDRSNIESTRSRQSPLCIYDRNLNQEDFNLPRSRRSISTDVGYEFRTSRYEASRVDRYDKQHVGSGKPPKHRSSSRTRTPSESSLGESEHRIGSTRGSPKSPRQDGSPKSYREGSLSSKSSPKSQRDSPPLGQLSREDSPATLRQRSEGSPRGARHVSFQRMDGSENSPKSPRSWGSPGSRRSASVETYDCPISERMTQSCTLPSSQSRSSPVSKRPVSMDTNDKYVEDVMSKSLTFTSTQTSTEEKTGSRLQRRGSIKELMHFFESKTEGMEEDTSSTTQWRLSRQRVQSVSPTLGLNQSESQSHESLGLVNVRHSLELPTGGSLPSLETVANSQPLRMGPKPFYPTKK